MLRAAIISAVLMAQVALIGCADRMINVSNVVLTSGSAISQGRRVPQSQFTTADYIEMLVDFTWSDPEDNGGVHVCDWKWFKDGKLVSKSLTKRLKFTSTPYTLHTERSAETLGPGNFTVQTIVDDKVVGTASFTITN